MKKSILRLILLLLPINLFAVGIPTINSVTVGTVNGTSAVINTTVWANGETTVLSIQYSSLNNNFTSGVTTVSMGSLAAGSSATPKSVTLIGLQLSTPYYFRIKAENNSGIKYAPNSGASTFTTASTNITYVLAQINNVSSTVISTTSAKIDFDIVPSNTTSLWVQYSTNPAFTSGILTQTLSSIPAGIVAVPVSTTLTGLSPATKYFYRVRTSNSVGDNYSPNSNFFITNYGLALISNVSSTVISNTSAKIDFDIVPNSATSVWLQYSTNPAFTSGLLTQTLSSIPAGTVAVPVSTTLTGLLPNAKYYYRVRTSNIVGDNYSSNSNFFIPTYALAQINNVSSTVISDTSAKIDFDIVPSNTTSVWVQYSTDPAFTSGLLTQTLSSIPAGIVAVPVSTTLTGLLPNVKYYYRVRTSNSIGDNYSPNSNFFITNNSITDVNSQISNPESIELYPNPAVDYILFKNKDEYAVKCIIDVSGKIILETTANKIGISHLPSGMYIVRYTNDANHVSYTKFMKSME